MGISAHLETCRVDGKKKGLKYVSHTDPKIYEWAKYIIFTNPNVASIRSRTANFVFYNFSGETKISYCKDVPYKS